MAPPKIFVMGASAGGVEAYSRIVEALPANFCGAIFLVLHIPSDFPSFLPEVLSRHARLPVLHVQDGAPIVPGEVRIAPPGMHTILESGVMRLVRGPRENRHRPAIDPLFRSAAVAYGSNAVGVILTGSLDDGTAGLLAIKRQGGITIVQDPADALQASMPASALAAVQVDYCVPLAEIPALLTRLAGEEAPATQAQPTALPVLQHEVQVAKGDPKAMQEDDKQPGVPSVFSCPECNGVLWEVHDGELLRFRCRVGHAYSLESIANGQTDALEAALWNAVKILEESVSLCRKLAARARERNLQFLVSRYENRIVTAEDQIELLTTILKTPVEPSERDPGDPQSSASTRVAP